MEKSEETNKRKKFIFIIFLIAAVLIFIAVSGVYLYSRYILVTGT